MAVVPTERGMDRVDLALLAAVCILALAHAFWFDHTADDAYISFRYVDNWVKGYGLVFNPGERVMGYSNFLWVVLLYPFAILGVGADTAARILGVVFGWGTIVWLYRFARERSGDRIAPIAATMLLASSGSFAVWMLGGLEGPLLAFWLVLGVTGALGVDDETPRHRFLWLGVVFGLASLTRPEAVIYVVPVAAWLWLSKCDRRRFGDVVLLATVAVAFLATLYVSAWIYYGDPLPNTYYAKAQPFSRALIERGLRMTRKFVLDYRWLPVGIPVLWLLSTRGSVRALGWLPLGLIATFVAFFVAIGGDMLQYHRLWVPMLPMFGILLAESVWRIRNPLAGLAIVALVVTLNFPNSLWGRNIVSLRKDDAFIEEAHLVAERLSEMPRTTLVAANNIGVIGYESRVRILDMLGLTDAHIARASERKVGIPGHEAHDGAYVLDREPDLIITGMPTAVDEPNPVWDTRGGYRSDIDLKRDPRFAARYELEYLRLSDGRWSPVWVRHGFEVDRVFAHDAVNGGS